MRRSARAREGGGPTLIEVKFTRYFGHFEGDQQTYRADEVADARETPRLPAALPRPGDRDRPARRLAELDRIDAEVAELIDAAVAEAKAAPTSPRAADLSTDVYIAY